LASRLRLPGVRELLVEHGVRLTGSPAERLEFGVRRLEIGVDLLAVGQIVGNRPIDLLEPEHGEGLRDALCRLPVQEGIDDGIEGDSGPRHPVAAFPLLHIDAVHSGNQLSTERSAAIRNNSSLGRACLLAISRSTEDPPSVAGFGSIVDGWGGTVAGDSDISQLNLQVENNSKFKLNAPPNTATRASLRFECNGFPLTEKGAAAELVTDFDPALAASWKGLQHTRLRRDGKSLVLRFDACRVTLPLAALAGGKVLDAAMHLTLGPGPSATYRVDLAEQLGGHLAGGMSFTINRP
jgi:hypothetical protein